MRGSGRPGRQQRCTPERRRLAALPGQATDATRTVAARQRAGLICFPGFPSLSHSLPPLLHPYPVIFLLYYSKPTIFLAVETDLIYQQASPAALSVGAPRNTSSPHPSAAPPPPRPNCFPRPSGHTSCPAPARPASAGQSERGGAGRGTVRVADAVAPPPPPPATLPPAPPPSVTLGGRSSPAWPAWPAWITCTARPPDPRRYAGQSRQPQ